jgi:hypothetical protein
VSLDRLSNLKAAIGDWTGRKLNAAFTANVPDFIAMAEARIFYGSGEPMQAPPLRVLDMEKQRNVSIVSGAGKLPVNFLEFKRLYWGSGEGQRLMYVPPREFWSVLRTGSVPQVVTIEGDKLMVSPAIDGTVSATYFARYEPLVNADDSNWVMVNAPSVYLQGALIEAWGWIGNPERQGVALSAYRSVVSALHTQNVMSRTKGETLRIRGSMW